MSMRILLFVQFLLVLLLAPVSVFSQQSPAINVVVKGVVSDSVTSETIPYATLRILDKAKPNVVAKLVPTDENGKFQFTMNKKGDYVMSVEFIGKMTTRKEFSIGDSKTVDMGSVLMQDNSKLLGEVVVSAQKPLVKVDLDKITYNMQDDPESKTSNVLDMLKKVPMVTVDGDENIELKGSTNFKIYMDGKPSNMISSNPKDVLKSMPAGTVKDIEVITDPGAKYDAEGVAGIINIITNKQTSMGGYTATVRSNVDSRGGFGFGGNLMLKYGKFGFMGNYNYYNYKNPKGASSSYREAYNDDARKYLFQNGTSKYEGDGQYGSGEFSYEIDTLNLINVGFNRYHGSGENESFSHSIMRSVDKDPVMEYKQTSDRGYTYGNTGLNVDYQRTSAKVKERLLTVSYRLNLSPDDWDSYNVIEPILNYNQRTNKQYSDGDVKEHTFQIDYTTPLAKIHTLETGLKYIIRQNESNSGYHYQDESNTWIDRKDPTARFKHEQDIFSAYLGYSAKFKKIGFKAGLRYESTNLDAKYPLASDMDFDGNYSNFIPSATITYQLSPMQNFRLGYNMRIMRPGIWQLNPFENTSDSLNVSVGNPNLDAVKSHALSLNYSYFHPKLNLNANLSYNFSDNSIERYSYMDGGVTRTTYGNIGENKRLGLYTYLSWTPTKKIRITSNISGSYVDIKSNNENNIKNSGFMGRIHSDIAYTFPQKFRLSGFGGCSTPNINLQGEGGKFYYYGFSLTKDLLNDKLNLRLFASTPFTKERTYKNTQDLPDYRMTSESVIKTQRFGLSVSFKFGEMKSRIKKTKRSITNDDSMGGGSGGDGGGGQGQQTGG
ncbi:TonB-dependent receptor family protein [Dysgonomonas sp. OttesenSCG-928-M03]|nr:TonB-dependent receptor family protein [Dysgonomonas sp. OttesenSCG-928-M03]